jgi:hypothetical protein
MVNMLHQSKGCQVVNFGRSLMWPWYDIDQSKSSKNSIKSPLLAHSPLHLFSSGVFFFVNLFSYCHFMLKRWLSQLLILFLPVLFNDHGWKHYGNWRGIFCGQIENVRTNRTFCGQIENIILTEMDDTKMKLFVMVCV